MKFNVPAFILSAFLLWHEAQGTPLSHPKSHETIPPSSRHSQSTTIFNVPLTDWIKNGHTDLQWYATITVGTPPQNFSVLIDTGSHALILPQNNCTTCSISQHKFTPFASSTFSWSPLSEADPGFSTGGDTIPLAEPQGARCYWAIDDVSILGHTTTTPINTGSTHSHPQSQWESKTAPSFTFLLCDEEDPALTTQPGIDGVLGLGLYNAQPESFQYALVNAGVLSQSGSNGGVFGLYTPSGDRTGAQITLGGVDKSKFKDGSSKDGEMVWISLDRDLTTSHSQWTTDISAIFVNGEQLMVPTMKSQGSNNSSSKSPRTAPYPPSLAQVLDSGTSSIMAPDYATAAALYAQISPKIYQLDIVGTWGCSCADMKAIVEAGADITFLLGSSRENGDGRQFNTTIPSSVFNLGPYPGFDGICQAVVNNWQDGVFYKGIGLWELGSPLLKNYYTAWDGENLKVGFAPLTSVQYPY